MATVVCEKHGLRYDPERADGCVICRREAGGAPLAPPARVRGRIGVGPALLLTVAIWLVGGFLLFAAHKAVARSFLAWGVGSGEVDPTYDQRWEDSEPEDPDAAPDDTSDEAADWDSDEADG